MVICLADNYEVRVPGIASSAAKVAEILKNFPAVEAIRFFGIWSEVIIWQPFVAFLAAKAFIYFNEVVLTRRQITSASSQPHPALRVRF